jgi:hypothetical protein
MAHMRTAAELDINPWRAGYGGELVSRLSALHPQAGRLLVYELHLAQDGWLSADSLLALAEAAENSRAQLVEISGPDKRARLTALAPRAKELPVQTLGKVGLRPASEPAGPGLCPLWGPCLGRRGYLGEAMSDLASRLAPELDDGFRVELAGCPLDCRFAAERGDLALVLDKAAAWFVVWLGGRHRPFLPLVSPKPWLRREVADVRGLLDLVFMIHDLWGRLAMGRETLPELAARMGLERLAKLLNEPAAAPLEGGAQ